MYVSVHLNLLPVLASFHRWTFLRWFILSGCANRLAVFSLNCCCDVAGISSISRNTSRCSQSSHWSTASRPGYKSLTFVWGQFYVWAGGGLLLAKPPDCWDFMMMCYWWSNHIPLFICTNDETRPYQNISLQLAMFVNLSSCLRIYTVVHNKHALDVHS